jgi:flagellar hook protein FlgE
MMRSLYAGVSGLQNHQVRMDVVGNNIANVNTVGFKKGRVNFQDLISQGLDGAASPNDEIGGVNPKQVGLGMNVATIDTIHTQGSLQTTGVKTDLAIQGNGFFVLDGGTNQFYSRAGAFGLDQDGRLVNPANGLKVKGWGAETIGAETVVNTASELQDLIVPIGSKDSANPTTEVFLACNLDKRTDIVAAGATPKEAFDGTWTTTFDVYDSFGDVHNLRIDFTRVPGVQNLWQAAVTIDPDAEVATNTTIEVGDANNPTNIFNIEFDNLGTLLSVADEQGDTLNAGDLQLQVGFDVQTSTPDADGLLTRQAFNLNIGEVGSVVNTVTQFAEKSSTKVFRQNGYSMGYLEDYKIDQTGTITGIYSNGANRTIGQMAIASFTNPGGLEKAGESTYQVSNNSGSADIGPSGIAGKGKLISGALEMSNVDLAEQFTDMIVTQRGFQANSKSITTSDQMLQELLTLKR